MTFQTSLDGLERRDWDTDPNGQIRMAVVGLGNYGRNVSVPAIEASDYCTFAVGVSGTPETRRAVADEHDDFSVRFPGAVGNFAASLTGRSRAVLALHGTRAVVRLREAFQPRRERTLVVETDSGRAVFERVGRDETREEFDYFAHCLLTGAEPGPDGQDGLADVETMMAVYESAQSGVRVSL